MTDVLEAALPMLATEGVARLGTLLSPEDCRALQAVYDEPARFRSRVVMARHGFGQGEYQYFAYPLPDPVQALRARLYERLVPIANRWAEALGQARRFPASLAAFTAECHAAGQMRPTPLLLRYRAGDYNCLHQDLYGEQVFPIQVVVALSDPADYDGGAFVLVEQRPRRQSRAEALSLAQGEALAFAVRERPVQGTRGVYRVQMKHGVGTVTRGARLTLGLIFHDAQ
ncbi:2OG-Fe(II) oxygenase [Elstera litoralis]|nr:2OG-Fe(II) oxygenase [Elstera litoralis]